MTISKELLDKLFSGVEQPEDFFGDNKGLMEKLKVRLGERMGAERIAHLGYELHGEPASQQSKRRNEALRGNDEAIPSDIPRDRDGSFEPEPVKKGQTRFNTWARPHTQTFGYSRSGFNQTPFA